MELSFDHAAIFVEDLERSRKFYEFLGGKVVSKPSPHFMEVALGQVRLHVLPRNEIKAGAAGSGAEGSDQGSSQGSKESIDHLCLTVGRTGDLEELLTKVNGSPLNAHFGPFEIQQSPPLDLDRKNHAEERPPLKTLYFRDPDGVHFEVRAYS